MKHKFPRFLQGNHFLFLLPVYFILHGYVDNLQSMSFSEALLLMLEYSAIAIAIAAVAWVGFQSWYKAAVFSFAVVSFHFFFGALHDGFKQLLPGSFLVQYSVVLPFSLLYFVSLILYLRSTSKPLEGTRLYLNLLFFVVLLIEVPRWVTARNNMAKPQPLQGTSVCDTCDRPDIYLIIADEYADSASLQQVFGFNNAAFQSALRQRGFHLIDSSHSNYNYTPFVMASLLQMNYLQGIEGRNQSLADMNLCYRLINNSGLWPFLRSQGYQVINQSIFNIDNKLTPARRNFMKMGKDQITANTFLARMDRDLRYHLVTDLKIQSEIDRAMQFMNRVNQKLLAGLLEDAKQPSLKPKFVYAHLTMPHYPYYYRGDGGRNPAELLTEGNQVRKPEYIEYLQFSNGIFLEVIDHIITNSKKPPVILFMGDHGFRHFPPDTTNVERFYYMNTNAVLLPAKNYQRFYEGISSVNHLRALLNTVFNQRLPMLKDSTILLRE